MSLTIFEEFVGEAARNLGVKQGFSNDKTKVTDWLDNENPPTNAKLNEEVTKVKAQSDAIQYQRDRQYPELGEQLDMLFHDMTAGKGDKTGEWYKAVAKVKADNPKPKE